MAYYGLLDRTPRGRHEEGELEHWLRRHDEYELAAGATSTPDSWSGCHRR